MKINIFLMIFFFFLNSNVKSWKQQCNCKQIRIFNFSLRNYRNAKLAGELSVGEIPTANVSREMRLVARKGGITTVNNGDSGRICRISGNSVEEPVGHDVVVIGEIEQVLDHEMVSRLLLSLFLRKFVCSGTVVAAGEKARSFHHRTSCRDRGRKQVS